MKVSSVTDTNKSTHKKRGRPTVLTAKIEARLLKLVSKGDTLSKACRKVRISDDAVSDREEKDAGFAACLARARVRGAWRNQDKAEDGLLTATPKNIQVRREYAHHQRWKSSKLIPRTFGDHVELTGAGGSDLIPPPSERQGYLLEVARSVALVLSRASADLPGARMVPLRLSAPAPEFVEHGGEGGNQIVGDRLTLPV